MAVIVCKVICSNSFKNEITYKLFTYKSYMYIYLNVCKQMADVKLLLLHSNTWNHLTVCKKSSGSFKNVFYEVCLQIIYTWYICIERIWH